jgi:tRNA(Ile)-lysidine synthase
MGLAKKVLDLIRRERLIADGDRVLLGVSGGADSVALFHLLREISSFLTLQLGVAHLNHMLRGAESDRDEAFVSALAEREGVPCYVERVNVKVLAASKGLSVQQAGRDVRYEFFKSVAAAQDYGKIAVAHTVDDQVETFLLRVAKGTGLKGLTSIPIKRENIIRPLLRTSRADIEAYLRHKGALFVEDSSNQSIAYERNFVRHRVVPLMEHLNPGLRKAVVSLLNDLTAINRIMEDEVRAFLHRSLRRADGGYIVNIADLRALSEEARFRVYSSAVAGLDRRTILQRRQGELIERICFGQGPNAAVSLPHGLRVLRSYGELHFAKTPDRTPVTDVFPIDLGVHYLHTLNTTLTLANLDAREVEIGDDRSIGFFDFDKIGNLTVRTFRDGDRFIPLGMKQVTKLKDFFIGQKVDRRARRHIPLLLSDDKIIWVIGHRIDERFKVEPSTTRILKVVALNQ